MTTELLNYESIISVNVISIWQTQFIIHSSPYAYNLDLNRLKQNALVQN